MFPMLGVVKGGYAEFLGLWACGRLFLTSLRDCQCLVMRLVKMILVKMHSQYGMALTGCIEGRKWVVALLLGFPLLTHDTN